LDRIIQAGGFVSVNTGGTPDANAIPIPKPNAETLARLIRQEGCTPQRTLVVDDMEANLEAAKGLGCKTVWISHEKENGAWDYHMPHFHHLPDVFGVKSQH